VRSQIKDLSLCEKKGSFKFEDIERTLDRETYLNSCPEETATELSVLELFPSLDTLRFFAVRNFDVNEFGKMDWRKIAMFQFSDMNIGPKMEWLGKLKVRDLFSLDLSNNILNLNKIPALVKDLKERCPGFCDLNLGLLKDLETRVASSQALERNLLCEKISVIRVEVKNYDQGVEIFYDDESEFQSSVSTERHSDEASGPGA